MHSTVDTQCGAKAIYIMLRETGWQGQNPSWKFVLVCGREMLMIFLVENVECAWSSLTYGQKLGSRDLGAVWLRRQRCHHGWWEEAVAVLALLYIAPHHLCYILLPFLTCLSYTCRWVLKGCLILHGCTFCSFYLHFPLQDYKLLFWKKIPPLPPNPLPRILAIGACLLVFQLCILVSLSSWFYSHVLAPLSEENWICCCSLLSQVGDL